MTNEHLQTAGALLAFGILGWHLGGVSARWLKGPLTRLARIGKGWF